MKPNLSKLSDQLGYKFNNKELITRALTHRSFLNESRVEEAGRHNERLEFLGDAVLELIVTEHLFAAYPERKEGDLTSFRAALVRTESLAEAATELGYGDFIRMSKGEEATGGRERPYILANTFEAVLGAIYLDSNYETCRKFIERVLLPKLPEIVKQRLDIDAKSRLQEISQEVHKFTPIYELVKAEGPDHERVFTIAVIIDGKEFGQGSGRSKQEAEQNAAAEALAKFN